MFQYSVVCVTDLTPDGGFFEMTVVAGAELDIVIEDDAVLPLVFTLKRK